jgi:7-carboxy-7-deazaguanine synthase
MKIKVSELFYSAQGEGRFVGVPSVFLRTFGCNFTCAGFGCAPGEKSTEADDVAKSVHLYKDFLSLPLVNTGCDSYASWHPAFKELSPTLDTDQLVNDMLALTPNHRWVQDNGNDVHLVITGGEPLLGWQRAYEELLSHEGMQDLRNITFETNGTQTLQGKFVDYLLDWSDIAGNEITFSVSPKLSASGEKWEEAIRPEFVRMYQDYGFAYLKFVVETEEHFAEVDRAVAQYRAVGFAGPVYVMPQGGVVTPSA